MPELRFRVRWPDDSISLCYSPSSTIREALRTGQPYPLAEFVSASTAALEHGSRRVAAIYGFGCGQALAQIEDIRRRAQHFSDRPDATVTVEGFED